MIEKRGTLKNIQAQPTCVKYCTHSGTWHVSLCMPVHAHKLMAKCLYVCLQKCIFFTLNMYVVVVFMNAGLHTNQKGVNYLSWYKRKKKFRKQGSDLVMDSARSCKGESVVGSRKSNCMHFIRQNCKATINDLLESMQRSFHKEVFCKSWMSAAPSRLFVGHIINLCRKMDCIHRGHTLNCGLRK